MPQLSCQWLQNVGFILMLFLGALEAKQGSHSERSHCLPLPRTPNAQVLCLFNQCVKAEEEVSVLSKTIFLLCSEGCFLTSFGGFLFGARREGGNWPCSFRSRAAFPQSASRLQLWL